MKVVEVDDPSTLDTLYREVLSPSFPTDDRGACWAEHQPCPRFYRRHGARVLDLPYFQPALGPGRARVPDLLLLALHVDPELHGPGGAETVAAEPLRTYLTEYLVSAEGALTEDATTAALWRALDRSGGVPVRPPARPRPVDTAGHPPLNYPAMVELVPFFVAGQPAHGTDEVIVRHPYDGHPVGRTSHAAPDQVERAVAAAAAVADRAAALPAHVRAAALDHVSRRLAERADEIAQLITGENGKPIVWARSEVTRAVSTFRWAAEEARRFSGELQRLDTDPASTGRLAMVRRWPRGPVLGITPFNFPLNLVAHKVAPALAVGAPIIVKPAPATPLAASLLGEILAEVTEQPPGLPAGMFSVLPLPNDRTAELVGDPRLPVVSFTGSGPVGAQIRRAVPDKHVTLELGGNAAAVICSDWASDEDFAFAARRIAQFSNYQAGQSCIAVQRVFVHEWLYDGFLPRLVAAVEELRVGDPYDGRTEVGPLISETAAQRVESWVDEAAAAGATIAVGGRRDGASYQPTVLTDVPPDAKVRTEELFGPVLLVEPVRDDEAAFAAVNDSAYGLQAGVFTHNLKTAFAAHRTLRVGGVIIGDVPSYRADQMPYGGVKGSGVGREGVRSAMDDYTEPRVMVLAGIDL